MLSPYTVLDLADDRGELTGMVLGDMGADVIKVESPRGSPSRSMGPFLDGAPEPERSLRFFAFNRNKRDVTLDLTAEAGRRMLLRLAERADFVIESSAPGEMAAMGLGFEDLRRVNRRIVYVAITPFGQDGPRARFAASDLTLAAMGGQMSVQGDPSRPPVRITIPQVWLHASMEALVGALVAHARMLRTGDAQYVDVSAQTAMFWTMLHARVGHAIRGYDFNRHGSDLQVGFTLRIVHKCADGYVVVLPTGAVLTKMVHWWVQEGVVPREWAQAEDWLTYDLRLFQREPLHYSLDEVLDAISRYALRHTKRDLLALGLEEKVTIAPVNTIADLTRFRHLEERGYWLMAPLPDGREVRAPGPFVRLTETPMTVRRWAPRLGQHNTEVLGERPGRSSDETISKKTSPVGEPLPFEGIKVVDFSWIFVGPTTGKYLADHGATVVRVETRNPPDRMRTAGPFKDDVPGTNRSHGFGDFNTSKLSLSLDLKNPAGLAVAHRLIAWADVLIESFSPGTMADLGIDYETVSRLNPSIIMASTALMGQTGPAAGFAGYGFHAGAIAGFYDVTGWPDLPPDGPWTAYTDTTSPRFLAAIVMAALDHRRRTGQGQFIDASQMEMSLHCLAPQIIDFNASGRLASRNGNRSETAAPHGAFQCSGEDQWCAIAVESDEQWRGLRAAIGDPAWARDARLETAQDRLRHQEEIERRLGEWTADRSPQQVMQLLQSAGVPAGVVQRSSDLLDDPQLAHRRFFRYMDHPEMGNIPHTGHLFRIRDYDSGPRFPAPLLGQHNELVLRGLLGMTEEEIADVVIAGALV